MNASIVVTTIVVRGDDGQLCSYTVQNWITYPLDTTWEEIRESVGRDNVMSVLADKDFTAKDIIYLNTHNVSPTIISKYLNHLAGIN